MKEIMEPVKTMAKMYTDTFTKMMKMGVNQELGQQQHIPVRIKKMNSTVVRRDSDLPFLIFLFSILNQKQPFLPVIDYCHSCPVFIHFTLLFQEIALFSYLQKYIIRILSSYRNIV